MWSHCVHCSYSGVDFSNKVFKYVINTCMCNLYCVLQSDCVAVGPTGPHGNRPHPYCVWRRGVWCHAVSIRGAEIVDIFTEHLRVIFSEIAIIIILWTIIECDEN